MTRPLDDLDREWEAFDTERPHLPPPVLTLREILVVGVLAIGLLVVGGWVLMQISKGIWALYG